MQSKLVAVPSIQEPITASPGFAKKALSDYKLDLMGLCESGCRYCSSNAGNYLRINRRRFAEAAEQQLGRRLTPNDDPSLTIVWPDVLERLAAQLTKRPSTWGRGKTLVFSMLTDGFSPTLVERGVTRQALELVLNGTAFRIRVLTKNAIVGSPEWIDFFRAAPGRFVVGLSTGSADDRWARQVELGTSSPTERLAALARLQDAGVATYGMLCPVMPDALGQEAAGLQQLLQAIQPERLEHVWAEPYNDRQNWRAVRSGYRPDSFGYRWLTDVYEQGQRSLWSAYATELYERLLRAADAGHWADKLRYLLYEQLITPADAARFQAPSLRGVLLQAKPAADGLSPNLGLRHPSHQETA